MAESNQTINNQELLIKHVFGNVMRVAIPLTQRIRTLVDGQETETESDFYPNLSKPIKVVLKREGNLKKEYIPTVEGNVVTFKDDGTLPTGLYDVTVLCYDSNSQPCRYMVRTKIKVVSATKDAGIDAGIEFDSTDYVLEGAVYFYAKGDKGDPFTFEDFTEEEILLLQKPAQDKADEVSGLEVQWTEAENGRVQAENDRQLAEQGRVAAEQSRVEAEQQRELGEQHRNQSYTEAEGSRDTQFEQHEQTRDQAVASAVANAKADYVGADNYVYHWNSTTEQYEKTNIYVKGDQGVSVQSVEQITTSTESGGVNVIRVTLTNGNTYDFEVRNGQKVEPRVVGTTLIL